MKIIFDAIDEQPVAVNAPTLPRKRAGLRNWQVAVIYGMIHTGVMTTVIAVGSGSNELGLYSLAFHGLALGLALSVGAIMRKL